MTNIDTGLDETTHVPQTRRRVILAAVVIVLVAALALTPPLINVDRLRHRIATSMSQSLGRPVHLDRVSFHLLPMPGFTLENLVVSEDPAFGYEPVTAGKLGGPAFGPYNRGTLRISRVNPCVFGSHLERCRIASPFRAA